MTLIDTVPGFAATLTALGVELGVDFPVEQMTAKLGPPLEHLLADHLAEEAVAPAGDRFRALYPEHAIAPVAAFTGAHDALEAVRRHGGRVVLVTGKHTPNARLHLDHVGLHVHDVEGALAAGAISVSVLTGGCTREELEGAGTHVVLEDLTAFPAWL